MLGNRSCEGQLCYVFDGFSKPFSFAIASFTADKLRSLNRYGYLTIGRPIYLEILFKTMEAGMVRLQDFAT